MGSKVFYCCQCGPGPAYLREVYDACQECYHRRCGACQIVLDERLGLDPTHTVIPAVGQEATDRYTQCLSNTIASTQLRSVQRGPGNFPEAKTDQRVAKTSKFNHDELRKRYAYLDRYRNQGKRKITNRVNEPTRKLFQDSIRQPKASDSLRCAEQPQDRQRETTLDFLDELLDFSVSAQTAQEAAVSTSSAASSPGDLGSTRSTCSTPEILPRPIEANHSKDKKAPECSGKQPSRAKSSRAGIRYLLCPFWRRDPTGHPQCAYKRGWETVSRLKSDHIKKYHLHSVGENTREKLQSRKRGGPEGSEANKWRHLYCMLFPDDDPQALPSPHHDYIPHGSLTGVMPRSRSEGRPIAELFEAYEQLLYNLVSPVPQPLLTGLHTIKQQFFYEMRIHKSQGLQAHLDDPGGIGNEWNIEEQFENSILHEPVPSGACDDYGPPQVFAIAQNTQNSPSPVVHWHTDHQLAPVLGRVDLGSQDMMVTQSSPDYGTLPDMTFAHSPTAGMHSLAYSPDMNLSMAISPDPIFSPSPELQVGFSTPKFSGQTPGSPVQQWPSNSYYWSIHQSTALPSDGTAMEVEFNESWRHIFGNGLEIDVPQLLGFAKPVEKLPYANDGELEK